MVRVVAPAAAELVADIAARPARRRVQPIIGSAGSGKTLVLQEIRRIYREAGESLAQNLTPSSDEKILVVDNGHRLPDADLAEVSKLARAGTHTIVFATESRPRQTAWSAAIEALTWDTPPVILTALSADDVDSFAAELGYGSDPIRAQQIQLMTGGLLDLVLVALSAGGRSDGMTAAVTDAVRERMFRLGGQVLSTVAMLTLTAPIGSAEVAAALGVSIDRADQLVDIARGTGLVTGPAELNSLVQRGALTALGESRRRELGRAVLDALWSAGSISGELAAELASHGVLDERLVEPILRLAADGPVRSDMLYELAIHSGADPLATHVRAAEAKAIAGDLRAAGADIDRLWADFGASEDSDPQMRFRAVRISACAAVASGSAPRAAELYDWLAYTGNGVPQGWGADAALAGVIHLAVGDAGAARRVLATEAEPEVNSPFAGTAVDRLLLRGLVQSLETDSSPALVTLSRAVGLSGTATAGLSPDTPAAVAAIAALQVGQVARARSLLTRVAADQWPPAHRVRMSLLTAWVLMAEGDEQAVQACLDALGPVEQVRDQMALATLRIAMARRAGDLGRLHQAWEDAAGPLGEYTVDLFGLMFVGEVWVAAARLGRLHDVAPMVEDATTLLAALGNPIHWLTALHWYGVHAAIAGDSPKELIPHAQALAEAARHSSYAAALASAGRTWIRVLGGTVDAAEVDTACRGLDDAGHNWDATRLAGQAALNADDQRVTAVMLQLARSLRTHHVAQTEPDPQPSEPSTRSAMSVLSEREREVVELLLIGLTYRAIGERLFISAKTVEHHVARIRRRIGAQTRSEMLSMLRSMAGE
ncbi:putative LuxR family transcriptional regulator [Gordonia effusa NBRC 100432]|uniref:Putative LuxR family transcriptional regulator n=1 Tax=Gordonia effusa NBRC 100432 TaxID=1077974 RepID=H0QVC9_9ACTN|nr:LuxR C-terminal-related transcriptional regulator [Gordonia effusa]GAB16780.1 putative LuxR family transcriptional regulator [Gordonia effusa NBRC 100432]